MPLTWGVPALPPEVSGLSQLQQGKEPLVGGILQRQGAPPSRGLFEIPAMVAR